MIVRPLLHPSVEDVTVEGILHALSDPVRVAIFTSIVSQDCSQNCSNYSHILEKDVPKSTLSQHFKVLREAGLIRGERMGVEMHNTSRCAEIDKRFPGLLAAIIKAHAIQLHAAQLQEKEKPGAVGRRRALSRPGRSSAK